MATLQKFGGNWTEEKLNIFTSYLDAYLIALQALSAKDDTQARLIDAVKAEVSAYGRK